MNQDDVDCPYCGERVDIEWLHNHINDTIEEFDWECGRCEKYFNIIVYVSYSYEVFK